MGYYFNSPNGAGSWWVDDGETPYTAQAYKNIIANQNTTVNTGFGAGSSPLQQILTANPRPTSSSVFANEQPGAVTPQPVPPGAQPIAGSAVGPGRQTPMSTQRYVPNDTEEGRQGGFRIRFRSPSGDAMDTSSWKFSRDVGEIDELINAGWKPIRKDGTEAVVEGFNGGSLIDGLPVNTVLTGSISQSQYNALRAAGKPLPSDLQPTPDGQARTAGTTPSGTVNLGNQQATAPKIPDDIDDILKQLIQSSLNQGVRGQQALTEILNSLQGFMGKSQASEEATTQQRNKLIQGLLGQIKPALNTALGQMGQGLPADVMSALNRQAIETPELAYQGEVSGLKSRLASRGAYGGGELPGSTGDIIRGYAPLMMQRDALRSGLTSQTALANEQARRENMGIGLNAIGAGTSLAGTLGNIFNPAPYLGAQENALGGMLSGVNAFNQAGQAGISGAAPFAGALGELQPSSFSNLLKSALLGTGTSALGTLIGNSAGGSGFGIDDLAKLLAGIFGGGGIRPGTTPDPAGNL